MTKTLLSLTACNSYSRIAKTLPVVIVTKSLDGAI